MAALVQPVKQNCGCCSFWDKLPFLPVLQRIGFLSVGSDNSYYRWEHLRMETIQGKSLERLRENGKPVGE